MLATPWTSSSLKSSKCPVPSNLNVTGFPKLTVSVDARSAVYVPGTATGVTTPMVARRTIVSGSTPKPPPMSERNVAGAIPIPGNGGLNTMLPFWNEPALNVTWAPMCAPSLGGGRIRIAPPVQVSSLPPS